MSNPLRCERCGRPLESDDAISIIEGVCGPCRGQPSPPAWKSQGPPQRNVAPPLSPPGLNPEAPWPPNVRRNDLRVTPPLQPLGDFRVPPPLARQQAPGLKPGAHWPSQRPVSVTSRPLSGPNPANPARFDPRPSHRIKHRRRDLILGVSFGLIITIGITAYVVTQRGEPTALNVPRTSAAVPIALTVRPANARVTLEGQEIGTADESGRLELKLPADGTVMKWLEVSAKGYHTMRRPVSAYAGVSNVTVELIQKPYDVSIRSEPPQAEVWINNELKGYSPLTITLVPGEKAQLALKRTGYETITQELSPPVESERIELSLALQAIGALARVETDPPGAQISVNGEPRGIAPMNLHVDANWLGKSVTLTASLAGHEQGKTTLSLPTDPAARISPTHMKLLAIGPQIEIATDPPGGRVVIDGQERGAAPVTVRFPPGKTGSSVVLEASLGASQFGRQEIVVPAAGAAQRVTIAMSAAQSVVFVLAPSSKAGADHFALLAQIKDQIHRLTAQQRFAVLVSRDRGILTWPEEGALQPASSDWKIRAYDMIRSIRPADRGDLLETLDVALRLKPTAIWLFTAGEVHADQLDQMGIAAGGQDAAIHFVTTTPGAGDEQVKKWALAHRGTFTILGRDRLPTMAMDTKAGQ